MIELFKNLTKYKKSVFIIILLLIVQAYCALELPNITSKMIDVGIQNSGVENILPQKITTKSFYKTMSFMNEKEKALWEGAYREDKDGKTYTLTVTDPKELEKLDKKLLIPEVVALQAKVAQEKLAKENKGSSDSKAVEPLKENVDPEKIVSQQRKEAQKYIDKMGEDMVKNMGIAYAKLCNKEAGLNIDKMQNSYLWKQGGKMFFVGILMFIVAAFTQFIASKVAAGVGRDLRSKIFRKVMGFSREEIDYFSTASLITRSTNDIQQIQLFTVFFLGMVLYAPVLGLGGIYMVAKTAPSMSWLILLGVLAVFLVIGFVLIVAMPKFKVMQSLVDRVNLVSREFLTGLSVIRAFNREKTEEKRFDEANVSLQKNQLYTSRVMTFLMPVMTLIMYLLIVSITWVSAKKIDSGNLQVGAMTAFIIYAMLIVMSFLMFGAMSVLMPRAKVANDRVLEVLSTETKITTSEDSIKLKKEDVKGNVVYENVAFKYEGAEDYAVCGISFSCKEGETLAIIGSTGSGKSTIVKMLPRFYDATEGKITLDGVDIKNLSLENLRDLIGFVPQKNVLFSGTIQSNLELGTGTLSHKDLEEVAKVSQSEEFIKEKKDGYEEVVSQGGNNLSGGQKQRIAIGRALAKKPKVLVFDDSFSALDMKTDKKLREALEENYKNTAKIIVAQRVASIIHADKIVVLDEGKIVGQGSHRDLLQNCTVYREIAKSQLSPKELGIEEVE